MFSFGAACDNFNVTNENDDDNVRGVVVSGVRQ